MGDIVRAVWVSLAVLLGCGEHEGRPESMAVDSGPVEAGPVEAGPVEAGPVEAGPVEAGPVEAGEPSDAWADFAGLWALRYREADCQAVGGRDIIEVVTFGVGTDGQTIGGRWRGIVRGYELRIMAGSAAIIGQISHTWDYIEGVYNDPICGPTEMTGERVVGE